MFNFNRVVDFTHKLIHGRQDFSPSTKKLLGIVGNEQIQVMEIQRNPLNSILKGAIDTFTRNPYDKLFHLKIVIQTTDHIVSLEKEEVIVMKINPIPHPNMERLTVLVNRPLTVNQLIANTRKRMGEDDFFKYDASHNNCQDFIKNILQSNQLSTPENIRFISQNTAQLFDNLDSVRKLTNTVTDIAGRFNIIREGGSLSKCNGLSSDEINMMLKGCPNFHGIYCKDELPSMLKPGWYIINMQDSRDGNGTHWVCFKTGKPLIYFDSFGIQPPIEVLRKAGGDILFNQLQIQDIDSTACGWFCIACIKSDSDLMPNVHHFRRFQLKFSKNTKMNDINLGKILREEGIIH